MFVLRTSRRPPPPSAGADPKVARRAGNVRYPRSARGARSSHPPHVAVDVPHSTPGDVALQPQFRRGPLGRRGRPSQDAVPVPHGRRQEPAVEPPRAVLGIERHVCLSRGRPESPLGRKEEEVDVPPEPGRVESNEEVAPPGIVFGAACSTVPDPEHLLSVERDAHGSQAGPPGPSEHALPAGPEGPPRQPCPPPTERSHPLGGRLEQVLIVFFSVLLPAVESRSTEHLRRRGWGTWQG
mmetsp:Transcript_46895/g.142058  ORF Transcript_46895/g.142058 Transcript_46895/m.142058 type:complete len:239 (-) Transcript_46895:2642-3358(-)